MSPRRAAFAFFAALALLACGGETVQEVETWNQMGEEADLLGRPVHFYFAKQAQYLQEEDTPEHAWGIIFCGDSEPPILQLYVYPSEGGYTGTGAARVDGGELEAIRWEVPYRSPRDNRPPD